MNFAKQYKISKGLFGVSLLGLGLFLGVWLKTVHTNKVEELHSKVAAIWIKTMQEAMTVDLELSIANELPDLIDRRSDSSSTTWSYSAHQPKIISRVEQHVDSVGAFISSNGSKGYSNIRYMAIENSNVEISIRDSVSDDSLPFAQHNAEHFDSIKNNLESMLKKSFDNAFGNVQDFKDEVEQILQEKNISATVLIQKTKDSLLIAQLPSEQVFQQPFSEEIYYLELDNYSNYILGEMWFELLMAFLLLGTISTAFYYILYSLKKQNELVAIKNDLISNITHELRTPIFTVSAALEALQSFNALQDPEKTKEYLSISQNELKRLSILVEKVLKTSIFEQPVADLNLEPVNLENLITSIVPSLQFLLEKYNASLEVSCLAAQPIAPIDKIHLTNVIYNLIDNALKYNDKTPQLKIELKDVDASNLQLRIQDNGMGIDQSYLDKIFDKFFRVPTGNQHNVKGYGLGLNYVAGVVKQHKGQIAVESDLGKGTTFIITIPKQA
ncbi:MAG: HAMP domain-containing histidine kinase [Aureispira sp.]|nr:HAMP domain-containing histidine kinase [Aureispira sp.]